VFLIVFMLNFIVLSVHTFLYIFLYETPVTASELGVLLSQCMLYVKCLTYYLLHMRTLIINSNSNS